MNEYGQIFEPQWKGEGSCPAASDFPWQQADPPWVGQVSPSVAAGFSGDVLDQELSILLGQAASGAAEETSAHAPRRGPVGRRHACKRPAGVHWWNVFAAALNRLVSLAVFAVVSTLSGMLSYEPLRRLATPAAHGLALWWPFLVFGPWLTGVLAISCRGLPARRTAGWCVLLVFTGLTVVLCLIGAPRTPAGFVTAGLPPLAALTCILLLSPERCEARHAPTAQTGNSGPAAAGPLR
ncbi:hypothetical protein PYK79_55865 [Streptomyces sp. ID05-04B]|uniref:hypothetical protein n=1 Tax=Streptomyces sp. ID05-04B TaxID=3028661 RepID=UPI0029C153CF|nr:hypothetical protein [Streptomyces sp. ID05-04B]MDX5570725.1 hypothetical protein [Streptomyces sp. ID05-04B]